MAPSDDPYASDSSETDADPETFDLDEAGVVVLLQRGATVEPEVARAAGISFAARYEDKASLGQGGMGEVRLCRDVYIGRDVALKTLRRDGVRRADPHGRFEREARLQGQLEHPSIVPLYDVGFAPDGAPYFTMKRVRGHTFKQILRGLSSGDPAFAPFTLRRRLAAFNQACLAVAYAHAHGVIHRDLKPANVILGDFGEVYVLDWGIAKVVGEVDAAVAPGDDVPAKDDATAEGSVLGTPGYMSPEMIRGENATLDARSDVYALGALLFALVTLRPLHERAPASTLLQRTLEGVDARPSRRFPNGRDLSPELDRICAKATALDREERYATVREMVDDVERFLDGDRDAERRQTLAADHVAAARAAAERSRSGDDPMAARGEAIREVNRALAIHPTDSAALATLLQLIVEAPPITPAAVEAELEEAATRERRTTERVGAGLYLTWAISLPLLFAMGIRSWSAWACTVGLVAVSAATAYWAGRMKGKDSFIPGIFVLLFSSAAIASGSLIFGPFLLLPAISLSNTLVIGLHTPPGWRRWLVLLIGSLSGAGPFALELLGVLPPSMAFTGDSITILPRMVGFPRVATLLFLFFVNAGLVLIPTLLATKVRDDAREVERRRLVQMWHLRQIVPDAARWTL